MKKIALAVLAACAIGGVGVNYALTANEPSQNVDASNIDGATSVQLPGSGSNKTDNATTKTRAPGNFNGYPSLWSSAPGNQLSTSSSAMTSVPGENTIAFANTNPGPASDMTPPNETSPVRKLIYRYENEKIPQVRDMIKNELAANNDPEVVALAKRLITSADPDRRRDGFELIQRLSIASPDVRAVIGRVLATEQNPSALMPAILALTPTAVSAAETHEIVAQLIRLSQHADDTIRSQSILQLARWDASGEATGVLANATKDESDIVRQAAIVALATVRARTEGQR